MAGTKFDAATMIESYVKDFAVDMTEQCATLRTARIAAQKAAAGKQASAKPGKPPADPPLVTFSMSNNASAKCRTPAEQAKEVVANKSWVCWGAHMADSARHVLMKADGTVTWNAKKTMADDWDAFKKAWAAAMKRHHLKNAKGKDGWYDGDSFHLELEDSKIALTDERAQVCLDEYARLTRQQGQTRNKTFEKDYAKQLQPYIDKYEKKK